MQLTYNDKSPMENHHLAATFKLLAEDQLNFLKGTPAKVCVCLTFSYLRWAFCKSYVRGRGTALN